MYHKRRNCLVIRRENWEGLSRRRISGAIYRALCSEMSLSPAGPTYELFCDRFMLTLAAVIQLTSTPLSITK